MKEMLEKLKSEALAALEDAAASDKLEALRVRYLGKKGEVTAILKQMGGLSPEERPVIGQLANQVRAEIESALARKAEELEKRLLEERLRREAIDVTIPGTPVCRGHRHPMSIVLDEVKDIFIGMGFTIAEGPEVELSTYDFDRLNIPVGHTVRDRRDTFYVTEDETVHLRCQTSPCRSASWKSRSPPSKSSPPAGSTGRTRWTPPIPPCSTSSRALWWIGASPWVT